jgi:choline dehydrogenase-like flavoprotein
LAVEPVDALIVGAGASGGVVAKRIAEAGIHLDWRLLARKQWATSPNIRGLREDYPVVEDDSPVSPLMFNGVGGSMLIFAGAWSRMLPSDFRMRSFRGDKTSKVYQHLQ